jgi:hypothetical protein
MAPDSLILYPNYQEGSQENMVIYKTIWHSFLDDFWFLSILTQNLELNDIGWKFKLFFLSRLGLIHDISNVQFTFECRKLKILFYTDFTTTVDSLI